MSRDGSTLSPRLPDAARAFYEETGPYSDPRCEDVAHVLFHEQDLEDMFAHLEGQLLSPEEWSSFLRGIVSAVDCIPPGGAATVERPDLKLRIRRGQAEADTLLAEISVRARELATLLRQIEDGSATVPPETYSALALIDAALGAWSPASEEFSEFKRRLSSYQRDSFPRPSAILDVLAAKTDEHPKAAEIFCEDPWLSSQKSTWRDFVRLLDERLREIRAVYGKRVALREKHWVALIHCLVSRDISRSSVSDAVRKLPPF